MKKLNTNKMWKEFSSIIKANTTEYSYDTWFTPLYIHHIDEDVNIIYLASKESFNLKILKQRYMKQIEETFAEVMKDKYKIIIKEEAEYVGEGKTKLSDRPISNESRLFYPRMNFGTFVVGNCNKYAHAAALAVAESPADAYNPLFLYGDSGNGKTHLMQAIGIYIIQNNPKAKVLYVTSEIFTNELIKAISENKMKQFKNKYRKVDVLLVDDIQFLENKDTTQEEFFHTFNALYEANKQIVISSDRHPKNLVNLEERLRSRFSWNLVADIQPADFETRVAIIKRLAESSNLSWDENMIEVGNLLAEQITDNIRELEGAFKNVIGFSNLLNEPIDVSLAKRALKDVIRDNEKAIAPERIRTIVAKHYKIKVSDMDSKKRNAEIAFPRQVAMYLCRENTELSHEKIGRLFGNRHYSTVIHSHEKISDMIISDDLFKKEMEDLQQKIKTLK